MTDRFEIGRRELFVLGATTCAVAAGCVTGATHPKYAPPPAGMAGPKLSIPMAELGKLGPNEALQVNPGKPYPEILVGKTSGGEWKVATSECTHWGCTVDWSPTDGQWKCPCHGSRYAVDGKVLEGPADEPLLSAPAVVEGDALVIDLTALSGK